MNSNMPDEQKEHDIEEGAVQSVPANDQEEDPSSDTIAAQPTEGFIQIDSVDDAIPLTSMPPPTSSSMTVAEYASDSADAK